MCLANGREVPVEPKKWTREGTESKREGTMLVDPKTQRRPRVQNSTLSGREPNRAGEKANPRLAQPSPAHDGPPVAFAIFLKPPRFAPPPFFISSSFPQTLHNPLNLLHNSSFYLKSTLSFFSLSFFSSAGIEFRSLERFFFWSLLKVFFCVSIATRERLETLHGLFVALFFISISSTHSPACGLSLSVHDELLKRFQASADFLSPDYPRINSFETSSTCTSAGKTHLVLIPKGKD